MSLKAIALGGHVVGLSRRAPGPNDPSPLGICKLGISGASTMLGFCNEHDARVFAPLETRPFTGTPEQLWLLEYRSLCRELYEKEGVAQALPATRAIASEGLAPGVQFLVHDRLSAFLEGTQGGLEALRRHKAAFDADYVRHDWNEVHGVIVWFTSVPPIMCSSLVHPKFDFRGDRLPDSSDIDLPDDIVALDILGAGDQGAAVLTWRTDSALPGEALARSLLSLGAEEISDAIVR